MKSIRVCLAVGLCLFSISCSKHMFSPPATVPEAEDVIAFENVNLVPMTAEKIIKNQTVLVKGRTITNIGPADEKRMPVNSKRIDGTGAYLMPGLADMHMHTRNDWEERLGPWPVSPLHLYLANGVTTIRCFGPEGGSWNYVLGWRDKINAGRLIGPTIYSSGAIIYGPVNNPQKIVQKQKASGFDFVKLYSFLSKDEFHAARADLILVNQNPLENIAHIKEIIGVMAAGRWYQKTELQKMIELSK